MCVQVCGDLNLALEFLLISLHFIKQDLCLIQELTNHHSLFSKLDLEGHCLSLQSSKNTSGFHAFLIWHEC